MDFKNIIQTKRFRRIHAKYPVSLEFLEANAFNIIKFLKYTVTLHVVLRRKLILSRKRRVFIKFNVLRKNLFSNTKKKRKRLLPWSQQMILHLRKKFKTEKLKLLNALADYHSDSDDSYEKTDLNPEEIQEKLKAQLLLLNNNKKPIKLLGDVVKPSNLSELSKKIFSRTNSFGGISNSLLAASSSKGLKNENSANILNTSTNVIDLQQVESVSRNSSQTSLESLGNLESTVVLPDEKTDLLEVATTDDNLKKKDVAINNIKKSFLDSLMNKICISSKDEAECDKTSNSQKSIDYDNDSDTGDFFKGFSASDIENHPALLPTPVVPEKNKTENAAFLSSEDLDIFFKENSLKESPIKLPILKKIEQGMISKNSVPPKYWKVAREVNLIKPRTVAEKRVILQKGRNYKYLMIENENTIYRELKRRSKGSRPVNVQLIQHVQELKVPFRRDLWKAMSWLSTETNNYYFQNIVIDKREVKLVCGPGNYKAKYLAETPSFLNQKTNCTKSCKDKQTFSLIRIRQKQNLKPKDEVRLMTTKKLNVTNKLNKMRKLPSFKPGPLSSKYKEMKKMFEPNCGIPDLYTLPDIQLEVYPKINHPLDNYIKSYLKLILPSKNISKEWAEFSVSTLIENQNEHKDALNSFTFTIPYQNNEKKILVRRLLDRKETYDDSIELQFRKNLNLDNKLEVECADILSGMIECVALSLGEDSLIKNETDVNSEKIENIDNDTSKSEIKHKLKHNTSEEPPLKKLKVKTNPKTRLLSELKRLNATIIDAAVGSGQQIEDKICSNDYCRLGCICHSLNNTNIVRNHCHKEDCIFNCSCENSSMDQEVSGLTSHITSEDALILRQKATARLARMEREFTSTVVLTNNETVLINESQLERKRRCTQRFLNYSQDNSDDEKPKHSSRKKRLVSTNTKSPIKEAKVSSLEDITYVSEDTFKMLKHCSLDLINLELRNHQKWCMVHCLYNCFCKCRDTEGKPFILKKENIPPEQEIVVVSRKPRYSFDKHEKIEIDETDETELEDESNCISELNNTKKKILDNKDTEKSENILKLKACDKNEIDSVLNNTSSETKRNRKKKKKKKQRAINEMSEKLENIKIKNIDEINNKFDLRKTNESTNQLLEKEFIILDKYTKQDSDVICRRVIRIPQVYKWRNKRSAHVAKRLIYEESESTNLLLRNRVQKSVLCKPPRPITIAQNSALSLLKPEIVAEITNNQPTGYTSNNEATKINNFNDNVAAKSNSKASSEDQGFLRISSVVSLGAQKLPTRTSTSAQDNVQSNQMIIADVNCAVKNNEPAEYNTNLLKTSPPITISNNKNVQSKCDNILNVLNYAVTKTMHNICQIQLKETKHIPTPVPDQLFISQWRHFRQAYIEGIIHVWEVQVESATYFTATMEFIPLIRNAFSVVNIKAIPLEKLSLFGKMLKSQFINSNCTSLSILMTGRQDHWRIIGMTKATIDYVAQGGVIKPTPQSHPWLSKKINKLYEYMARQHFSKIGKKMMEEHKEARLKESVKLKEKLKMNVDIRNLSEQDIQRENLIIPLTLEKNDHKWLILDITDDFSHILFLDTVAWLSINKIKMAFQKSQDENKMVRLPKVDGNSLDCYITKNNLSRIYLGPYPMNKEAAIVLFQCVNGKMVIREHYELKFKKIRSDRTNGFWLGFKEGRMVYDLSTNAEPAVFNNNCKTVIQVNQADWMSLLSYHNRSPLLNKGVNSNAPATSNIRFQNNAVNTQSLATMPTNSSLTMIPTNSSFTMLPTNSSLTMLPTNSSLTMLPANSNITDLVANIAPNFISNTLTQEMQIDPKKEVPKSVDVNFIEVNCNAILRKNQPSKIVNIANNKLNQMEPGNYEISKNTLINQNINVFPTNIMKSSNNNNNNCIASNINMPHSSFLIPNHNNFEMNINQNLEPNNIHKALPETENMQNHFSNLKSGTNNASSSGIISIVNQVKEDNNKLNNKALTFINNKSFSNENPSIFNNSKSTNYIQTTETQTKLVGNPANYPKIKVVNINNFINTNSCAIDLPSEMPNNMSYNVDIKHGNVTNDAKQLQEHFGIRYTDENTNLEDEIINQNNDNVDPNIDPLKFHSNFENSKTPKLPNICNEINIDDKKPSSNNKSFMKNSNVIINSKSIQHDHQAIHGYFFSDVPLYPKFGGIKRSSQYLIRMNKNFSLQLNSLVEVSVYLNRHVKKHNQSIFKPEYERKQWDFKPIVKSNNVIEVSPRSRTNILNKKFPLDPLYVNDPTTGTKAKEKIETTSLDQINNVIIIDD